MARIRSIKPEFWHDPELAEQLTRDHRLLYIGLWNLAYDNWTLEYDPRNIKREIFGYDDDVTAELVDKWVREIAETGRVHFYTYADKTCIYLPKCAEHQRVSRPSNSPIPPPDSVSAHGVLSEGSRTELVLGAGSRKGKERVVTRARDEDSERFENFPPCLSTEHRGKPFSAHLLEVCEEMFGPSWVMTETNRGRIAAKLIEGCPPTCDGSDPGACMEHFATIIRTKPNLGLVYHCLASDPRPWAERGES